MFYMFWIKNIKSHFLCFFMLMIRMPETAKIRITIQVKDLYIADDVLYYVFRLASDYRLQVTEEIRCDIFQLLK